jgi:glutamyl-tRNA synthetase
MMELFMTVRTRFAPSPTGFLHIGGARTALYSWLYARRFHGTFILRIEDTDVERSTPEAVDAIIEGMSWLGLNYDEGPFYQTKRLDRYREIIDHLLKEGDAYRCYCAKDRLEKLRAEQTEQNIKPRYDGRCREGSHLKDAQAPFVIRFRNPHEGLVEFDDLVRGKISTQNSELDDLVILRSDGMPTYNFTVVVDDWDMEITHVIRGDDHINNTPRQINILKALNAPLPKYAHIPMILGEDGKRLSKRLGAASVLNYREEGYLPEALLNYFVRLGWSNGDQEIFSNKEMTESFDMAHVSKAPAAINPQKLQWLNQHYLKTLPPEKIVEPLAQQFEMLGIKNIDTALLAELITAQAERCKTLKEMAEKSRFIFQDFEEFDAESAQKNLTAEAKPILQALYTSFDQLQDWSKEPLHQVVIDCAEKNSIKLGKVAQPLRVALSGCSISPPIDLTLHMLGKEKVLNRIQRAINDIET